MKFINILIFIFQLFLFSNSLDNSTLSNYKDIIITNLTGVLEPDFQGKIVNGNLNFEFLSQKNGSEIILDTKYLNIISISKLNSSLDIENKLEFKYGNEDKNLGKPLIIKYDYKENETIIINIIYSTTVEGTSAQFLDKNQTIGKKYPYFFTFSDMIIGRELIPSQDTPAVKFPFYLGIKVIDPLKGMISGLFVKEVKNNDNSTTYYYEQKINVPIYLIGLAAGNIQNITINEIIEVYSEPEYLDKVNDTKILELQHLLNLSEQYLAAEYEWGKYNILILPNSYPYSGMEYPCLSFTIPGIINGEKTLVDRLSYELMHSWFGNLITQENWRDYWLNKGLATYFRRKILGEWIDPDYGKMEGYFGSLFLRDSYNFLGKDGIYTTLFPNLTGVNPKDSYSDITVEKGYNFLYYIEGLIKEEKMQKFLQNFVQKFKYKSIDFYDFQNLFINFCKEEKLDNELAQIDWQKWIFGRGECPVTNDFSNKYFIEINNTLERFLKDEIDEETEKAFKNWNYTSRSFFIRKLGEKVDFLNEKQHNFFTTTLKLYKDQDFITTTYYYKIILPRTDKFYENELNYLLQYLSNYSATDYMGAIYEFFYKRDEIKAVETFNNLKGFYHTYMVNMVEKELNRAKQNFPILTFDFSKKDECSFFSKDKKIDIISNEYKDDLGEIIITEGVYLVLNNNSLKLECHLDPKNKYCLIKEGKAILGEYNIEVPSRIQKKKFAIKIHNSNLKIKTYEKEIKIDEVLTKKNYEIEDIKNETEIIKIYFLSEPDKDIHIISNGKIINCELKNLTMDCPINNIIASYNKNNQKEIERYELKVVDLCNIEKYNIIINVKKEKESSGLELWIIILITVGGIVLISLIVIFLCIVINKRKKDKEERTLSEHNLIIGKLEEDNE